MSIDVTNFEPLIPKALDSSMIGTYLACPSKFYLEYILGLRPRGPEKIALTYGTLWHEVMELWQTTKNVNEVLDHINMNVATFSLHDPKNRTAQRMAEDFAKYLIEYQSADAQSEVLAIEQGFDLELPNGIRYTGRMDQMRRNKDTGKRYVFDHKTTTFFTKNYFDNFELGIQLKGYVWALQSLMVDPTVDSATLDVYHILKNETKWYRRTFTYRPVLIDEWLTNICHITDQIMLLVENHLHDPDAWIMNSGQRCSDYGGCPFTLVHQLPPERGNRERLLTHEFEVVRWDPITHGQDAQQKPEG